MKRFSLWVSLALIFSLLAGCSNADGYIKEHYNLVDVQGVGKTYAKIYSAPNKSVPTVAHELALQEKPQEISKDSTSQMFLVYQNKVVNIQQDPKITKNTLVELDTVAYARQHYSPSFLQGYITASILHSLFGSMWYQSSHPYNYRGYTYSPKTTNKTYGASGNAPPTTSKPATSQRTGTFKTKTTKKSGGFWSSLLGTIKSRSRVYQRKNDGSTPRFHFSKPRTSRGFGSFRTRRR